MINKPVIILLLTMFHFSVYAQQTYKLDIKKSKISWKSPKTITNRHYGYLLFNSGSLNYSPAGEPTGGSFNLNMNSIKSTDGSVANNQKVDGELKSFDFFAVEQYPAATINVKKIIRTNNLTIFKVTGDLTIKGITNAIEFMATIKKSGNTINVTAELTMDRIKWNINHKPKSQSFFSAIKDGVIADEIPISLNLTFNK